MFDAHTFDDLHAPLLRPSRQRHRQVDGVHAAVARDEEAGEQVVGAGQREPLGDIRGPDLVNLQPVQALERRNPTVFVQSIGVGGRLDEPHGLESRRQTGIGFETRK